MQAQIIIMGVLQSDGLHQQENQCSHKQPRSILLRCY